MVLDARRRSSLYGKFVPLLGEDDANALMSEFTDNEADQLVTRQFLRAELGTTSAGLRSEFHVSIDALRSDFHASNGDLRSEFHASIGELRSEVHASIDALRSEVHASIGELRSEFHASIDALRSEFHTALAEYRAESNRRFESLEARMAGVEGQLADLRVEMADRFRQQTVVFGGAFAAMTAVLGTLITLT
ncbi:MAG: hypothetical protein U5K30_05655 [Acidimicrobiales bacterium]|nr:hypothetical protein [Acidimicrobiales bacterium]